MATLKQKAVNAVWWIVFGLLLHGILVLPEPREWFVAVLE